MFVAVPPPCYNKGFDGAVERVSTGLSKGFRRGCRKGFGEAVERRGCRKGFGGAVERVSAGHVKKLGRTSGLYRRTSGGIAMWAGGGLLIPTLSLNLIPIIDILLENTISIFKG